jgi:mannose-1-phosphate guanylyltransferase
MTKSVPNLKVLETGSAVNRWAVILAGGDGTRLRSLTRSITGDERPKQFVPVIGGKTLLDQTRRRVATAVSLDQTLFVVTEKHERYYRSLARNVGQDQLLVQPTNKGTAPAIVYALMRIAAQSPRAVVAFFPSDHYFADDELFMSHVEAAFDNAALNETVTLLGITPEAPEVEYGWIEPHASILNHLPRAVTRVRRFWEKPTLNIARRLMQRGCLWNSFVMVGRVDVFLRLVQQALPGLYSDFGSILPSLGTAAELRTVRHLYSQIPDSNFSQQVLAVRPDDLTVMKVEQVGWSDLGEPSRVLSTLGRLGMATHYAATTA